MNAFKNSSEATIQNSNYPILPIHNYQRNRILTFIAPKVVDPSGTGASWNANQAKISTATEASQGKGFTRNPIPLGYLPKAVAHNDFIFSVIAEETGFIGSIIIGLFSLIIANGIDLYCKDSFGSTIIGISVLFSTLFHKYWHGNWINSYYRAASFSKLRRLFCLKRFILQGMIQSIYRFRKDFS